MKLKATVAFCAFAGIALLGAALPANASPPDPYQIFANARQYWLQQRYPMQIRYQVAVAIVEGGKERVEHYDAVYDAVNNIVNVDPVSDYELEHPVKVSGVNIGFFGHRLNKPLVSDDFLGVPRLAPNYSFAMAPFVPAPTPTPFNPAALVAEIRQEFHDPNPRKPVQIPQPPGLREIGTVVARSRDYDVSLLGTENVDGHDCYHLGLKPMRDPGRYRIREAWIDEKSYAPWQLKDAVNFVNGPATSVPWTIRFADINGAHYIREERADAPLSANGEIYTSASIQFQSIVAATLTPHPDLPVSAEDVLDEP